MLFQHTIWCKCLILDLVSIEMFSLHTCQCPPSWLFDLCYFCSGILKFAGNLKNCNPAASIHLFPQSFFLFTSKCCTNSLANEMLRALSLFLAKHALIWLYSHQLNMHEILILQSDWYWKLFSFLISLPLNQFLDGSSSPHSYLDCPVGIAHLQFWLISPFSGNENMKNPISNSKSKFTKLQKHYLGITLMIICKVTN